MVDLEGKENVLVIHREIERNFSYRWPGSIRGPLGLKSGVLTTILQRLLSPDNLFSPFYMQKCAKLSFGMCGTCVAHVYILKLSENVESGLIFKIQGPQGFLGASRGLGVPLKNRILSYGTCFYTKIARKLQI